MKRTVVFLLLCSFAHQGATFAHDSEKRHQHEKSFVPPADVLGTGFEKKLDSRNQQCTHRLKAGTDRFGEGKIDAATQLQPYCPNCQDIQDRELRSDALTPSNCVVLSEDADSAVQLDRDVVSVLNDSKEAAIAIEHKRGIGHARFELKTGEWPAVRLRFKNFKRLEGLMARNGDRIISLFDDDSSPGGQHLDVKRKSDGFEVRIPPLFLHDSNKLLGVEWVDFYR